MSAFEQAFVFRPLVDWPTPSATRKRAPFRAPYSETLRLLIHELDMLGNTGPRVIQVALSEADIRRDGLPRANARPAHPAVALSFTSRHGPMHLSTDTFDDWRDNLRAIALGLESLRRVDRYGIARSGEQYAGWLQLEASTRGSALIREHGGVRAAMKATHPDRGGDAADFHAVVEASRAS